MAPLVEAVGSGSRVLVLLAHPDDEALLCGGTLATFRDKHVEVRVVCFSDGAQGRDSVFVEACAELGVAGELLGYETNALVADGSMVSTTDMLVRTWQPTTVVTHSSCRHQHQDHVALHTAVRSTVMRSAAPSIVLGVEPAIATAEFTPNVFVDVTAAFDSKLAAVKRYRDVLDRDYMEDEYLYTKAAWWGQVSGAPRRLVEALELVMWR